MRCNKTIQSSKTSLQNVDVFFIIFVRVLISSLYGDASKIAKVFGSVDSHCSRISLASSQVLIDIHKYIHHLRAPTSVHSVSAFTLTDNTISGVSWIFEV